MFSEGYIGNLRQSAISNLDNNLDARCGISFEQTLMVSKLVNDDNDIQPLLPVIVKLKSKL